MNSRNRVRTFVLAGGFVLLSATLCLPLIIVTNQGTWPSDWPKQLETLRAGARTIRVATGIQENIYDLGFKDRESFEKAWPAILKVKTPGAPVTLYRAGGPKTPSWGVDNPHFRVRIFAPPNDSWTTIPGVAVDNLEAAKKLAAEGKVLFPGPPWPKSILSKDGELPEYVESRNVDGRLTWVEVKEGESRGFRTRARIDVHLLVDGKIVNLNRIPMPARTPIVDRRF